MRTPAVERASLSTCSLYNVTWNGTVTHNSNGITGNGSNGYGVCGGLTGGVHGHLCGLSAYVRVGDATSSFGRMLGHANGDSSIIYSLERCNVGGFEAERLFLGGIASAVNNGSGPTPLLGLFSGNRTATNAMTLYRNGSAIASSSTNDTTTPTSNVPYLLALNVDGTAGSFTTANLALAAIHQGLTSSEAAAFNAAVQEFQSALGRNV